MRFYLEPKPSRRSIPFSRPVATSPVAAATEPTDYRSTTRHRPSSCCTLNQWEQCPEYWLTNSRAATRF